MIKEFIFWLALPGLVAFGSAALVWMMMQARMQLLTAKFQAALAQREKEAAENRPGVEELLAELRFERRRFVRKITGPQGIENSVLTLERLYFRQIPLTGWMQEEIQLGQGEELSEQTSMMQQLSAGSESNGSTALVAQ
ncbi:MAG: hypothetical protein JOZ22_23295 [Acidobacteriia bacterium]|nr:hypothetical protein [Terriglobia bacterium]MBV9743730.1 hypothetical protein [Terriglobia bacterium]